VRRRPSPTDAREIYAGHLRTTARYQDMLGYDPALPGYAGRTLARLEAGEAMVTRGSDIDATPHDADFCLESDGTVTPVSAVYVDPAAAVRTVLNYRRPDGTMVRPERT